MARAARVLLAALLVGAAAPATAAERFLSPVASELLSRERVARQLRQLLGQHEGQGRLAEMEEVLRPSFQAMPKTPEGGLDHRVARYALHRHFLAHRGWSIKGLALEVDETNSSLSVDILKSRMPSLVITMLEGFLGTPRLGLAELAVLAVLIEDLVHTDAVDTLQLAYQAHSLSTDELLEESRAVEIMQTFLLFFIWPASQSLADSPFKVRSLLAKAPMYYPGWEDASIWAMDLKHAAAYADSTVFDPFDKTHHQRMDFNKMVRWAAEISAGIGRFADLECKQMKNRLLDLEDLERADGRIRLSKFYAPFLEGDSNFHFSESPEYLKHLGALDESVPGSPSAIVPNVIYARANCLSTSGFHSLCCIDECERLMVNLEEQVSDPLVPAQHIADAVAGLASETVAAPRALPPSLRERLDDIAGRHGGRVPLHGRLFAQWMHYAFPNECPYPRSLLTDEAQMTPVEWMSHWNQTKDFKASVGEMEALVKSERNGTEETLLKAMSAAPVLLWSDDEELLSDLAFQPRSPMELLAESLRCSALAAACLGALWTAFELLRAGDDSSWSSRFSKPTAPRGSPLLAERRRGLASSGQVVV